MAPFHSLPSDVSRRRFLRQSFAFSALAALGSMPGLALPSDPGSGAAEILMVGDWGYENFTAQTAVAKAMREYVQQHSIHTQALLMLGDNWYGALEGGVQSPRWQTQFEEMYPADVFAGPAYAILGNHDYQKFPESKVDSELEYARIGRNGKSRTRWTMPSRWYTFEFPAKNPMVTFIALDSNMPYPDGSSSHGKDFTLTPEMQADQLAWLEVELKRSRKTPHLIVMGHHPVYSNGPHGDHKVLIKDWDPLFRKYNVPLYLAGHDHDLQHLEFEGHPTSFFLSGGGGADLYNLKIEEAKRGPYADKVYGFSHLSVTPTLLTLKHLDDQGRLVHEFTKTSDGKMQIIS
jgi:tartrate-resistant acid phosphatase type 5